MNQNLEIVTRYIIVNIKYCNADTFDFGRRKTRGFNVELVTVLAVVNIYRIPFQTLNILIFRDSVRIHRFTAMRSLQLSVLFQY